MPTPSVSLVPATMLRLALCCLPFLSACTQDSPREAPPPSLNELGGARPTPPLDITRDLREKASVGSAAQAVLDRIRTDATFSSPFPPVGPRARDSAVPGIPDSAFKGLDEFTQSLEDDGKRRRQATDAEVKLLIDALRKSLKVDDPASILLNAAATGRWLPELTLGFHNDEVRHGRIGWHMGEDMGDLLTAMDVALARGQRLVTVICEDLNEWCGRLAGDVLQCPAVNRFAGHAVFAWVRSPELAKQLEITEYPAVLVFASEGKRFRVVAGTIGFTTARPLGRFLEEHLGAAGDEREAETLARQQVLFSDIHKPNACGD